MKNTLTKLLLVLPFIIFSSITYAGSFSCSASSQGYCSYHGYVSRVYVNRGNILLIYTDAAMDLSKKSAAGTKFDGVTQATALAIDMNKHYEFGKNIQALALSALMGDKKISVQIRDTYASYFQIDRLWLFKE